MTLTFLPPEEKPRRGGKVVAIYSAPGSARTSARVPDDEIPPGYRRPKHGTGLLRDWQKGERPPGAGTPTRYTETLKLARQHSAEALLTLVQRMKDPDGRIAVVAANSVLERAWGKAREMKPEEQAVAKIDLSALSGPELQLLMRLVESGRLKAAPEPVEGEQIEGSATEPDRDQ